MTENELREFAQHITEHCKGCKYTKPGWGPSSCTQETCLLHRIRLLDEIFKTRPQVLKQLLVGTRRPDEVAAPTANRIVK